MAVIVLSKETNCEICNSDLRKHIKDEQVDGIIQPFDRISIVQLTDELIVMPA